MTPETMAIQKVKILDGYNVSLQFSDGTKKIVDLDPYLHGPVFRAVRRMGVFRKVVIDEFGGLAWPNGADLCPDALYENS